MNTMTRTVGIQKMAGHISGTGYGSIVRALTALSESHP